LGLLQNFYFYKAPQSIVPHLLFKDIELRVAWLRDTSLLEKKPLGD
jgi:hypothetical protein